MFTLITRSLLITFILAILLCGVYPLVVTGIGKIIFPSQSSGGIITSTDGRAIGSKMIGQKFLRPEYFHGRPSAAGQNGYDAGASSGSNLGPTSQKLADGVKINVETVLKENPTIMQGSIPVDMVTASGSGLDPHISPKNAFAQLVRVAQARGIETERLRTLVQDHIEGPQLGLLGDPVVNVFLLNLALDRMVATK